MAPDDEIQRIPGSQLPPVKRDDPRPIEEVTPKKQDQDEEEKNKDEKHHGGKDPNTGRKLDVDG